MLYVLLLMGKIVYILTACFYEIIACFYKLLTKLLPTTLAPLVVRGEFYFYFPPYDEPSVHGLVIY